MSHPTCCCSVSLDRCDRCDLLVGLEGFHLMSVARTPDALMLDIESCDRCAGCPGCGVIAQGHGRVVVEVIDAPWAVRRWPWAVRRRRPLGGVGVFSGLGGALARSGAQNLRAGGALQAHQEVNLLRFIAQRDAHILLKAAA
mgnify:CR=1 FL=1